MAQSVHGLEEFKFVQMKGPTLFSKGEIISKVSKYAFTRFNDLLLQSYYFAATTYASMRRQFDREILKHVPFTASDTFRGQFEKVQKYTVFRDRSIVT